MPAIPWPVTLPSNFVQGTYAETFPDGRLITEMDAGPAKVRRRSAATPGRITGEMCLTFAELAIFREFYFSLVDSGTLVFSMDYPPGSATGVTELLLRFAAPPQWRRVADLVMLALDWEIVP